jgi:hypothetical protein
MSDIEEKLSVSSRKFYRVILESVDSTQETLESFAIKLSMRLRTPFPRVRQVVRNLPHTVKSNLTAAQANRLKAMIEEVGGQVKLETHFATPGETRLPDPDRNPTERDIGDIPPTVKDGKIKCPSCGWESEEDAQYCTICLRRFRDSSRNAGLGANIPHDNPLDETSFRPQPEELPVPSQGVDMASIWARYKLQIVIGGAVVLLLFILALK